MISKIGNEHYYSLDKYLDLSHFLSLRNDLNFLVSKEWKNFRSGIWNAAGHSPTIIDNCPNIFREKDFLYFCYHRANKDRKHNKELDCQLDFFEKHQDKEGLSKFLKLSYNAFDPYYILNLSEFDEELKKYKLFDNIVKEHTKIQEFILSLPFQTLGRITVFYNEHYVPLGHHRDYNYWPFEEGDIPQPQPHRNEFIWLRFDLNREFYLYDIDEYSGEVTDSVKILGHSAFFNDVNWHGNISSYSNSTVTIKICGEFTDKLRKDLGIDSLSYY